MAPGRISDIRLLRARRRRQASKLWILPQFWGVTRQSAIKCQRLCAGTDQGNFVALDIAVARFSFIAAQLTCRPGGDVRRHPGLNTAAVARALPTHLLYRPCRIATSDLQGSHCEECNREQILLLVSAARPRRVDNQLSAWLASARARCPPQKVRLILPGRFASSKQAPADWLFVAVRTLRLCTTALRPLSFPQPSGCGHRFVARRALTAANPGFLSSSGLVRRGRRISACWAAAQSSRPKPVNVIQQHRFCITRHG